MKHQSFYLSFGLIALVPQIASSATHTVTTVGLSFSPKDIAISVGDTVRWEIGSSHNVVQTIDVDSCTTQAGGFMSGASETDLSVRVFEQTFDSPGLLYYKCNPHCAGGMRGSVNASAEPDGGPNGDSDLTTGDASGGDNDSVAGDSTTPESDADEANREIPTDNRDDSGGCMAAGSGSVLGMILMLSIGFFWRQRRPRN